MDLLLHTPNDQSDLAHHYKRAFENAAEFFIVTAYLTDWDDKLKLQPSCSGFRIIIGKDFGITRKAACEKVMRWLPSKRKGQFMVADGIAGFHPKAIFWKEKDGRCFSIVGSSNLTRAAFETNYEANMYSPVTGEVYAAAKRWVRQIEKKSVVVSEDWLKKYHEAKPVPQAGSGKGSQAGAPVAPLPLPNPVGIREVIHKRRGQLTAYQKKRAGLMRLFRRCASAEIGSEEFFNQLPTYWSSEAGDRLQGAGWERQGKDSDFCKLSKSFLRILDASPEDRDDAAEQEIDTLKEQQVSARGAFLSEMLCLRFPEEYPVLNKPVKDYLLHVHFKGPRGASEGVRYVDLARKLRSSLIANPNHSAKNLAELDTVIWLAYGKKSHA